MALLDDYIKNGFPESKKIDRETHDHICRLCGEWVTTKSSCGKRYFEFQGRWINGQPKCDPSIHHTLFERVPAAIVPICDVCYTEKYNMIITLAGAGFDIKLLGFLRDLSPVELQQKLETIDNVSTAILYALCIISINKGSLEHIKVLLEYGASPHYTPDIGPNIIIYAATNGDNPAILEYILSY